MCRLAFIMIVGAFVLLTNLQQGYSFSHHRLNVPLDDIHSHEHNDDSNEHTTVQSGTIIKQSDENNINSEEMNTVRWPSRRLPVIDHSLEEDHTTDGGIVLVKLVKRDIHLATIDHSSEIDTPTEATNQSDEHDDVSAENRIKRNIHQLANTILERVDSSEEDTTNSLVLDSRSNEQSDEIKLVKRDVQQIKGDHSSEEDTTMATVDSQSDEHDIDSEEHRLVKRDSHVDDHSSEEDTTETRLFDNQTVEDDDVDSISEERKVKRNIHLQTIVDHSSEEHTTDSLLDQASLENSIEDAFDRSILDVKLLLPSTALRI